MRRSAMMPPQIAEFVEDQLGRARWAYDVAASTETDYAGMAAMRAEVKPDIDARWRARQEALLGQDDTYFRGLDRVEVCWSVHTGQLLSWRNAPAALEIRAGEHDSPRGDQALARLGAEVSLTKEHRLSTAACTRKLATHVWTYGWKRYADDSRVVGDDIYLVVNRSTGAWIDYRRGRCAPLPQFGAAALEQDIRPIAEARMRQYCQLEGALEPPVRCVEWIDGRYQRVWKFRHDYSRPMTDDEREMHRVADAVGATAGASEAVEPAIDERAAEPAVEPWTIHDCLLVWVADGGEVVYEVGDRAKE